MRERTAAEVMNPEVVAVAPDMTVHELAAFLTERQITGAPVVDAGGRLVGVVSETDIAEGNLEQADTVAVREIMTPAAYTIPHDTAVGAVARTMVTGRIHRLLVTRGGRVVGIVTTLDLLKLLYAGKRAAAKRPARGRKAAKRKPTKAR